MKTAKKCKHEYGWLTKELINVFVFEDGTVQLDFSNKGTKNKVLLLCNMPKCGATRNGYFLVKLDKMGKIKTADRQEQT